jgi:LPXTG-site transpeptidase (sortase) family protein
MSRSETIRFLVLRTVGNFFVLVALYGVVMTFGPALKYEIQYLVIQYRGVHFTVEGVSKVSSVSGVSRAGESGKKRSPKVLDTHDTSNTLDTLHKAPGFADILAGSKEQILTPIDPLFSILIPKLGIDEQVVPNVDPDNPNEYLPVLQHAVAHAKGSVLPGDSGVVYLFAHSADNWWDIEHYNAIFYTLNNLSDGDEIVIFYNDRRYNYVVSEKVISDPKDMTYLTAKHAGPQQLVLQTCWPPGTSWKRLYIVAKPKGRV